MGKTINILIVLSLLALALLGYALLRNDSSTINTTINKPINN